VDWKSPKLWSSVGISLAVFGVLSAVTGYAIYKYYEKQFRINLTREKMEDAFKNQILPEAERLKAFPDPAAIKFALRNSPTTTGYDAWSNGIRYIERANYFELRSCGPDGEIGTPDDIIVTSRDFPASFGAHHNPKTAKDKNKNKGKNKTKS
jgi:hypothetical protein